MTTTINSNNNAATTNFNDSENKANISATKESVPIDEPVNIETSTTTTKNFEKIEKITTKSAYHSFYVFPRSEGSAQHSPNLLWHEVKSKLQGTDSGRSLNDRGRSLSPSVNKKVTIPDIGHRESQRYG